MRNYYEIIKLKQSKILFIIKLLSLTFYFLNNSEIHDSFYLYLSYKQNPCNIASNFEKIFKVLCFNPAITIKDIIQENPYSLIFTSGNLKPFDILEKELGIEFNIIFENDNIINKDQFKFTIIKEITYEGNIHELKFDIKNRNNEKMIISLGELIINLSKINNNNGGILVFFPSYKFMDKCYDIWKKNEIDKKIEKYKYIILDSLKKKLLSNNLLKLENKNFILLSVHRGSSSEGIDFSNDNARMAICVGIPFANFSDDTIKKKIEYLDGKDENKGLFYSLGSKWYEADAMINVNQSLGRVIRNKNDYGVMICIDERFCLNSINNLFSDWLLINKEIKSIKENDNYFNELDQFYSYCQDKYLNKRNLNIMNDEKNKEKQNNLLEFNEIINNKNINLL